MPFVLKIKLGNAAMSSFDDIARALELLSCRFEDGEEIEDSDPYDRHGKIRDENGNTVGQWDIK